MTARQSSTEQRIERTPVSGYRSVLTFSNRDPAFVYRWVNDIDDRIKRFLNGGYEHVSVNEGDVGEKRVGTATAVGTYHSKPVGQGITAYLMKIRREWYEQDQKEKLTQVREQEQELFNTKVGEHGYGSIRVS